MKQIFTIAILIGYSCFVQAQNKISETGNVGIGTTDPNYPLQVIHPSYSITEDGTNYKIGTDIGIYNTYNITSGKVESGYRMGLNINAFVNSSDFKGTLKKQIGIRIQQGAYTNSGTGTIDDCYGLYLQGLNSGSTTITNKFGIYQTGPSFKNYFEGNIGIGTTTPKATLHVKGDIYLEGTSSLDNGWGTNYFYWRGHSLIMGTKPGTYAHNVIEIKPGGSSKGPLTSIFKMHYASAQDEQELRIQLHSSGNSFFNGGNVGIGCTAPDAKLVVNGTIKATEIKVVDGSALPCSDYVFETDYNLRPLAEVESFVKENKHLPEVPSAQEFQENGYSVGEMDDILLRKIEELTLYVIELKKEKDAEIESLKIQIENLQN